MPEGAEPIVIVGYNDDRTMTDICTDLEAVHAALVSVVGPIDAVTRLAELLGELEGWAAVLDS